MKTRKWLFLSIYTVIVSLVVLGLTQSGALGTRNAHAAGAPVAGAPVAGAPVAEAPAVEPTPAVQGAQATNPCGLTVNVTNAALKGQQGNSDIVQVNWEFKNLSQCLKVDKSDVEVTITRGGTPSTGKLTINGNGTVATILVPRVAPGAAKTPSTIKVSVKSSGSLTTSNTGSTQGLLAAGS